MSARFGCFPARPLLLVLSILNLIGTIPFIDYDRFSFLDFIIVLSIFWDVFQIVAILKRSPKMLLISRYRIIITTAIFVAIPLFISPVYWASKAGAGLLHENDEKTRWLKDLSAQDNFFIGIVVGLLVELTFLVLLGFELIMYILTTRVWRDELSKQQGDVSVLEAHELKV